MPPLTPAQQAAREGKVPASFLPWLMAGDDAKIYVEWLRLIGDPSYVPEDMENNWPVQLGTFLETFTLNWHERKTAKAITRRGENVQHPTLEYVACTLDGWRAHDDTTIDCKVTVGYKPIDEIVAFYTPQVICQQACVQSAHGALLIVHGGTEPVEYVVTADPEYERVVWERVAQFQYCVENMIEPVSMPRVVPPEQWRTVDLDSDAVNWATEMKDLLLIWDQMKDAADAHKNATEGVKKLLPADVGEVTWSGGVGVKRNRASAVTIKRAKT